MTCRVGFLFKAGRIERLRGKCPTEFFYGMPELAAAGWDIEVITDADLDVSVAPRSVFWRALSRLTHSLVGLSVWVPTVLARRQHLERLNKLDVIVATTNSHGLGLGVLKRIGLLRPRVVYLAMGLVHHHTSPLWKTVYRWALRDVEVYALADADSRVMQAVLRQPVATFLFGVDSEFWHPNTEPDMTDNFVLGIGNDRARDFVLLLRAWKPEYPMLKLVTNLRVGNDAPNVTIIRGDWHAQSLSDAEIRRLYQHARFVVLPIKETFQPSGQSACLQAMACGSAVAITDFSGLWNREAMIDGQTCVLMQRPGSEEAIQAAVERLLQSPEQAREIGANARRMIENRFHVGAMADAMATALARQ